MGGGYVAEATGPLPLAHYYAVWNGVPAGALPQLDRLNVLVETASAHARVVAVGDATDRAGRLLPDAGDTICAAVSEMRMLLLQIERQPMSRQA